MKFKFPLQKVLEHRKVIENIAQKDFQEAQAISLQHQKTLGSLENQMRHAYDEAFQIQHSKSGSTSESLKQIHDVILGQKLRIQRQKAKIQESEKLVEACREILREKAVDYKIIERLKERRKEDFISQAEKQDQKDMDEISVIRKVYGDRT